MRFLLLAGGAAGDLLAQALEAQGHGVARLAETAGDATDPALAAALHAVEPHALIRVGGGVGERRLWAAATQIHADRPHFEIGWADPPDEGATPVLAPVLAGGGLARLPLRGPGDADLGLLLAARAGETGPSLLGRALGRAAQRIVRFLADSGPGAAPGEPRRSPPHPELSGSEIPREVDWGMPALGVVRHVRALAGPLGGATTTLAGTSVALLCVEQAAWTGARTAQPGSIASDPTGVRVRCGSGALRILAAAAGGATLDRSGFAAFVQALGAAAQGFERSAQMLPFGVPAIGPEEEAAIVRTLRSRWIGTGPTVDALEREFGEATGASHAVAVSSCTAALHLALLGAGVEPGDEVITTALTFVATVNAIAYTGARPVLVDVEPDTLNLDPRAVEAALSPRTRAIVPVHFGGRPCDMVRLRAIASRHGVALVEDAAHAVGAIYPSGRAVGSGPSETCFSFYPNKNLTTCEGGMIATRSAERARRYRRLRMHGLTSDAWKRFGRREIVHSRMVELGYKYNLTDLQAALGRVQLAKLEDFTQLRNAQAAEYRSAFADLERIRPLPPPAAPRERHAYHLFTVRIAGLSRDAAQEELRRRGIGAAVHYEPVHLHPYYRERLGMRPGALPVAEEAGATTLTLPIGPSLRSSDVAQVIEAVRELEALSLAGGQRARAGSERGRWVSPTPCERLPTTSPTGWSSARR